MHSAIFPRQNFKNNLEQIKEAYKTPVSKANSRFLMAHCMIQFVWTADQAKTPAGVVSVDVVSIRKICEMSTLKHFWMILKACLTRVHSCMQCAIVSKE